MGVLAAVFTLVPLGPALIGRVTLLDVGALSAFLPFRASVGDSIATVVTCRRDTFDYYLPGIAEIKRSFFAGEFPTWAPYEVGGAPLASLPNHGALSPMSLPYFVLPLWLAPVYVKLLEFVVAIGGTVLFLRRLGLSTAAGLLAGVVFAGSGFMIMWTNWPHTRVAALIPALFWALERLVQEVRARDVVVVGVVVASMLLGGFPAIVLFSHTVAAAYVLVRVVQLHRRRPRRAVQAGLAAAGGVLLGVGLSALQIIPFAANLGVLDLASREEHGHHLPLYTALTVIDPYAVGTCVGGVRYGPVNPIEAVGFLGAAAVGLAAAALVLRRRAAGDTVPTTFFAVAAAILAVGIWVGGPVLTALYSLPLWSTNFIGRAQSVLGFLVAVLVGVAFDRLVRGTTGTAGGPLARRLGRHHMILVALAAVGCGVITLLVTAAAVRVARAEGFGDHLRSTISIPVLLVIGSVVLIVVAARGRRPANVLAPTLLAVLVVVQSTVFAGTLLPGSRRVDFYPMTPTHTYLSENLHGDRYGATGNTMFAPTSDYYELRTPVGHEFTDQRWKDIVFAADPQAQLTVTYSTFSPSLPIEQVERSPALDQLAVRYWVTSPSTGIGEREPMSGGSERLRLDEGEDGSCSVPGGPLRGIRLQVAEPMPTVADGRRPMLHVAVTGGGVERQGAILIDSALDPGRLFVAIAGEDLPTSPSTSVRVWLSDTDGPRTFEGHDGSLSCSAIRPIDDGLQLVHSDAGGAVYRRVDALPRIRWASRSRVVTDRHERIALVDQGVPTDTVLLEDDRLPVGSGRPAGVRVLADQREGSIIDVDAEGDGYLVVADSIVRPGWGATVDGSPVALAHGNHAFAAVPVPEGRHRIELAYRAPGLTAGVILTVTSLLLAAIPVVGPMAVRRRRTPPGVRSPV